MSKNVLTPQSFTRVPRCDLIWGLRAVCGKMKLHFVGMDWMQPRLAIRSCKWHARCHCPEGNPHQTREWRPAATNS